MKRKTTKMCLLLLSLHLAGLQAVPALGLMAQEPAERTSSTADDPDGSAEIPEPGAGSRNESEPSSDQNPQDPDQEQQSDQEQKADQTDSDEPQTPAEDPEPASNEEESPTTQETGSAFTQTENGLQYILEDGTSQKGWFELDGSEYYADPLTGIIQTGEKQLDGNWYYFLPEEDGRMAEGFVQIPAQYSEEGSAKTCYYAPDTGIRQSGWVKVDGKTYNFLRSTGRQFFGEVFINGAHYYLDPEDGGAMTRGFITIPAKYSKEGYTKTCYYNPSNGARKTGWVKVDGKTYNFYSADGRQFFGEVYINGIHYYLDPEDGGAMAKGFVTIPAEVSKEGYQKTCYYSPSNGARKTGWVKVDGKSYNFYSVDGRQFFGEAHINGVDYYLDPEDGGAVARGVTHVQAGYSKDGKEHWYFYKRSNGARTAGWIYDGDDVYNFNTRTFNQVRGEANINGPTYFFDPADGGRMARGERLVPAALSDTGEDKLCLYAQKGYRISGWTQDENGKRFWDRATGALQKNSWLEDAGNKYFLDENGNPLTGTHEIDGVSYTFASTGALYTGWQKIDGKWYLYSDTGERLTGWQEVNGKWYWMDEQGVMASSRWIGDKYVLSDGAMAVSLIIDDTWYVDHTGNYIKNGIAVVDGRKYGFGPTGRMEYTADLDEKGNVTRLVWKNVAYYSQRDPRWSGTKVGKYYFDGTGCGPTSAAMIMQTLYQKNFSPIELGRYFEKTTTFNQAQPGMWSREFKVMDKDYGTRITLSNDRNMALNALKNGDMVIVAVTRCLFAWDAEHFLVLAGYNDGNVYVRDAYTPDYDGKWYSLDYLMNHLSDDIVIFRNPAETAYH